MQFRVPEAEAFWLQLLRPSSLFCFWPSIWSWGSLGPLVKADIVPEAWKGRSLFWPLCMQETQHNSEPVFGLLDPVCSGSLCVPPEPQLDLEGLFS